MLPVNFFSFFNQIFCPGRPSSTMTPPAIGPNGKPMVKCDICGKTLADPSSLYRHRKIHSGDKPHKCPYCGRLFIQRYIKLNEPFMSFGYYLIFLQFYYLKFVLFSNLGCTHIIYAKSSINLSIMSFVNSHNNH